MRISAGSLKGRIFDDPPGNKAHPMSDRIRNALFNSLGDITELTVLDAFGGSGALTFEAISRGASQATICELDQKLANNINTTAETLDIARQVNVVSRNVYSYLNYSVQSFDVVILDPPFQDYTKQKFDKFCDVLKPNGLLVLSFPSLAESPHVGRLKLVKRSVYGNASLAYYKSTR